MSALARCPRPVRARRDGAPPPHRLCGILVPPAVPQRLRGPPRRRRRPTEDAGDAQELVEADPPVGVVVRLAQQVRHSGFVKGSAEELLQATT